MFSGAIARVEGQPTAGDEVEVLDTGGAFVARGLYNPDSQIRVRLYAWERVPLDAAFFRARLGQAVALRSRVLGLDGAEGACRLVFSEGDGLSGLTVDRYRNYLSVQLTSRALAERRATILDTLEELSGAAGIVLRTEKGILEEEGLELRDGPVRGSLPDQEIDVVEGDLSFLVSLATGQKTGFYLDQRVNRARAAFYARDRSVADVCCYSGGFGITALASGATRVVGVDVSSPALALADANARRNGHGARYGTVRSDAFRWLEGEAEAGRRYGMIVLDPPRFARSKRGVPEAVRAYRRLNELALRCLEPAGILVTCSCSGRVSRSDFRDAVAAAGVDAGRSLRLLEQLGQAPDHPVSASCPETEYLKCLICLAE